MPSEAALKAAEKIGEAFPSVNEMTTKVFIACYIDAFIACYIDAEYAPLLAAKDAEIAEHKANVDRLFVGCDELFAKNHHLAADNARLTAEVERLRKERGDLCQMVSDVASYKFANPDGKTVLDFMRLWLEQSEDRQKELESDNARLTAEVERLKLQASINRSFELADDNAVLRQENAELKRVLRDIASFTHDCGCVPCTGQCRSKESLEIIIENMVDSADAALKEPSRD